ncbi:MAG: hypothetical protein JW717_06850 [Marinilabiliaceae bacterium]|nr:hypothetical protein [Marinilabiliaceae bacterium]
MKEFLIIVCLAFFVINVQAKRIPGYIILENRDTIWGEIELRRFNFFTGNITLGDFDFDLMHKGVEFRKKGGKRSDSYLAEELKGFCYQYKNTLCEYRKFIVDYKSIVPNETQRSRLLKELYKGSIVLYKDVYLQAKEKYTNRDDMFTKVITYYIAKQYEDKLVRLVLNQKIIL